MPTFKELYKTDNQLLSPEPELLMSLAEKMREEAEKTDNNKKSGLVPAFIKKMPIFRTAAAAAALFIIIAGAVLLPVLLNNGQLSTDGEANNVTEIQNAGEIAYANKDYSEYEGYADAEQYNDDVMFLDEDAEGDNGNSPLYYNENDGTVIFGDTQETEIIAEEKASLESITEAISEEAAAVRGFFPETTIDANNEFSDITGSMQSEYNQFSDYTNWTSKEYWENYNISNKMPDFITAADIDNTVDEIETGAGSTATAASADIVIPYFTSFEDFAKEFLSVPHSAVSVEYSIGANISQVKDLESENVLPFYSLLSSCLEKKMSNGGETGGYYVLFTVKTDKRAIYFKINSDDFMEISLSDYSGVYRLEAEKETFGRVWNLADSY